MSSNEPREAAGCTRNAGECRPLKIMAFFLENELPQAPPCKTSRLTFRRAVSCSSQGTFLCLFKMLWVPWAWSTTFFTWCLVTRTYLVRTKHILRASIIYVLPKVVDGTMSAADCHDVMTTRFHLEGAAERVSVVVFFGHLNATLKKLHPRVCEFWNMHPPSTASPFGRSHSSHSILAQVTP